ncbi:MAG: Hsp20/alpha crystallin family protein, partial [Planctomycetes bacterium]|nr:Hsp20/alpha crystallin family protein [Planctomycetota bacterium]
MSEIRLNIGEIVQKIQEDVKRLVKGFSDMDVAAYAMGQWVPAADVLEGRAEFRILVDLPGVAPDKVEVTLQNDQVKVSGEKTSGGDGEGFKAHLSERRTGAFNRTF